MRKIFYYLVHRELERYKDVNEKHQYFLLDTEYNCLLKQVKNYNANNNYDRVFDYPEEEKLEIKPCYPCSYAYKDPNVVVIDLPKASYEENELNLNKVKQKVEQYQLKQKLRNVCSKLRKIETDFN